MSIRDLLYKILNHKLRLLSETQTWKDYNFFLCEYLLEKIQIFRCFLDYQACE